jgi:KaiC/GvpD/RAD55 family RecA-like ATPase/signal recognition particle receptor subunit beta
VKRIKSGMKVVDKWLGGGFPVPCSVIFLSEGPTEKRMLAEQFIVSGLQNEEKCLYIDFYRLPSFARSHFKRYGTTKDNDLVMVDAVSSQIMVNPTEDHVVRDVNDVEDIRTAIQDAIEDAKPTRIVFDSLDFLTDRLPRESVLDLWDHFCNVSKANNSIFLTLFTNWTLDDRHVNVLKRSADCIVEFKTEWKDKKILNMMKVHEWKDLRVEESRWMPFEFEEFDGAINFIPRILVTGSEGSGRDTFLQSIFSRAVVDEDGNAGAGVDRRKFDISSVGIDVFGDPGDESFGATFRLFCREVSGVFLVLDNTRPEDIEGGKAIVASNLDGVPMIVVASGGNAAQEVSLNEIRHRLNLPESVPVVEMSNGYRGGGLLAMRQMLRLMEAA